MEVGTRFMAPRRLMESTGSPRFAPCATAGEGGADTGSRSSPRDTAAEQEANTFKAFGKGPPQQWP